MIDRKVVGTNVLYIHLCLCVTFIVLSKSLWQF